jgi:hypothetical protein
VKRKGEGRGLGAPDVMGYSKPGENRTELLEIFPISDKVDRPMVDRMGTE